MVEYHTLPPISVSALTELWNFLRLDTIEERRLEILQTEGVEGLAVYDAVLKFLNTYILVAEDRMPEELFNTELRRMLPIIRQARRYRERIVVGPINEILLAILRKLARK